MVEQLMTSLSQAVYATPMIALAAAAGWGILSILLSPCHLASIPLIVGFIDGQEILWGDTHHPGISETNGDYNGIFTISGS